MNFLRGYARSVDINEKTINIDIINNKTLELSKTHLKFDKLVVAVGIQPKLDNIPGNNNNNYKL